MTAKEMWNQFRKKENINVEYEAWAFGGDPDGLAQLVLQGTKTATASAFPLYAVENEPLPKVGDYSVILDSRNEAVCIVQITRVYVVPFCKVSSNHAYREGEGDRSLTYWRQIHKNFFTECLAKAGLEFNENIEVVCEEFELVFR